MINLKPVCLLTARQLIDEYDSCIKIVRLAATYYDRGYTTALPQQYTITPRGNLFFFYNKLGWIEQRFLQVVREIRFRGLIFPREYLPHWADHLPNEWWQDWDPAAADELKTGRRPRRSLE